VVVVATFLTWDEDCGSMMATFAAAVGDSTSIASVVGSTEI